MTNLSRGLVLCLALLALAGCESLDPFAERKTPLPGERQPVFSQQEIDAMTARGKPQSSSSIADIEPVAEAPARPSRRRAN